MKAEIESLIPSTSVAPSPASSSVSPSLHLKYSGQKRWSIEEARLMMISSEEIDEVEVK